MKRKRILLSLAMVLLGGLIMLALSSCGVNKNSREWIEKNRVADIYKVYPTKNPEELFKLFPDGFVISQAYVNGRGQAFHINLKGNPESKTIRGEVILNPNLEGEKKIGSVAYTNGKLVFSQLTENIDWPVDVFLFQKLAINQQLLDTLDTKNYNYNSQNGSFHIEYNFRDSSRIDNLLKITDSKVIRFEIIGDGENYFRRTVLFEFSDGVSFSETIKREHE